MNRLQRKYFPERKYRLPTRWLFWGIAAVLLLTLVAFMKIFR